jgi:hypothetical protein
LKFLLFDNNNNKNDLKKIKIRENLRQMIIDATLLAQPQEIPLQQLESFLMVILLFF